MTPILGDPDALIAEIVRRAQQKAVDVEAESNRQVSALLEQARKDSDSVRAAIERETAGALETLCRRSKAQGELEAQRHFTALRESPINQVWALVEARLRRLTRESAYTGVLKLLAMMAADELGPGPITLAADPVGHSMLSEEVLKAWSTEAQIEFQRAAAPWSAWGGLVGTRGRMRVNLTFPAQLTVARTVLRERVFEILAREGQ